MPTLVKIICQAALEFTEPFTVEDLTVRAWNSHPVLLGLRRGFELTYPDHNRVLSSISGRGGLIARGGLVRCDGGRFRAGPMARHFARS